LARLMTQHNIDIYLLQETWLLDDWTTHITPQVKIIHHGPKEALCNRGSGGVTIMLGPRAQQAWKDAGAPDPFLAGDIIDSNTRFMGIDLTFFPRKRQATLLFIGNVYAPYTEMENDNPGILARFYDKVGQHLTNKVPRKQHGRGIGATPGLPLSPSALSPFRRRRCLLLCLLLRHLLDQTAWTHARPLLRQRAH
jgi:exonuclease III